MATTGANQLGRCLASMAQVTCKDTSTVEEAPEKRLERFYAKQRIIETNIQFSTPELLLDALCKSDDSKPAHDEEMVFIRGSQTYSVKFDHIQQAAHLTDGLQYRVHEFDHNFDYASNIFVYLHFDKAALASFDGKPDIELCITCGRFVIYSTKVNLNRAETGQGKRRKKGPRKQRLITSTPLLIGRNLIPVRYTPSGIHVRVPKAGILLQADVHVEPVRAMNPFVASQIQHWFSTPTGLPVCVFKSEAKFDRARFITTVPDCFKGRYICKD